MTEKNIINKYSDLKSRKIPRHSTVNSEVQGVGEIDAEINNQDYVLSEVVVHELLETGGYRVKGGDNHQRNLDGEEDSDDDDEHHGGVVSFSLSLVLSTPAGQWTTMIRDLFSRSVSSLKTPQE